MMAFKYKHPLSDIWSLQVFFQEPRNENMAVIILSSHTHAIVSWLPEVG